jgi:gluconolactonase
MRSVKALQGGVLMAVMIQSLSAVDAGAASGGNAFIDAPVPVKVDRMDAGMDAIVPPNATVERVATGFTWVEGPVWIQQGGYLLFAEITSNSIRKLTPDGTVSIFLQPSGYKGSAPYGGKEPGSNGMTLDAKGRLTVAGHAQRDVYTDPPYGLPTQGDDDPIKELQVNGVYRIPHALQQKPGAPPERDQLQLVSKDLPRPNGIAFSPDQKYLYVDNSGPQKLWMRYEVEKDGSLSNGKVFYDASSDKRPGGPDGMKVDRLGNVYSTGPGGIWVFSPEGKALGVIFMPERTANLNWAGADRKTLYITASSSIYRITLMVPGI